MTSPEAGSSSGPKKHNEEQVTFQFCHECSNMLYPKEDKAARKLKYTCRTCHHTVDAPSNCIYRNVLKSQVGDTAGVTQDVAMDPTVGGSQTHPSPPVIVLCGCCGQIIMCSDCGLHPAVILDDGGDTPSTLTEARQPELQGQTSSSSGSEDSSAEGDIAWSRVLEMMGEWGEKHLEMDMDMDLDLDDDMDDWEVDVDQQIYGPPNKPKFA